MFTFEDFAKNREGQRVENSCVLGQKSWMMAVLMISFQVTGQWKGNSRPRSFWMSEAFLFTILSPEKKGNWQT